jgi:hypothetical protein
MPVPAFMEEATIFLAHLTLTMPDIAISRQSRSAKIRKSLSRDIVV